MLHGVVVNYIVLLFLKNPYKLLTMRICSSNFPDMFENLVVDYHQER